VLSWRLFFALARLPGLLTRVPGSAGFTGLARLTGLGVSGLTGATRLTGLTRFGITRLTGLARFAGLSGLTHNAEDGRRRPGATGTRRRLAPAGSHYESDCERGQRRGPPAGCRRAAAVRLVHRGVLPS
jgi:hypothetical protein